MHQCHGRFKAFGYFIYEFISLIQVLLHSHLIPVLLPLLIVPSPLPIPILLHSLHIHPILAVPLPNVSLISSVLMFSPTPHMPTLSCHLIILILGRDRNIPVEFSSLPQ